MMLIKHTLKRSFIQPAMGLILFLLPIALVFVPLQENMLPNSIYLYGMIILFTAFMLCKPIVEERQNNIAVRIASSPTSYSQYLWTHLIAYLVILMIQNGIFLTGIALYFPGMEINYLLIMSLYIIFDILSITFSLFWNSLFKTYTLAFSLYTGFVSVLCLITGISMPLRLIPENIQRIIVVFPTYWLPYGLDAYVSDNIGDVGIAMAVLLAFSAIFFAISSRKRF